MLWISKGSGLNIFTNKWRISVRKRFEYLLREINVYKVRVKEEGASLINLYVLFLDI